MKGWRSQIPPTWILVIFRLWPEGSGRVNGTNLVASGWCHRGKGASCGQGLAGWPMPSEGAQGMKEEGDAWARQSQGGRAGVGGTRGLIQRASWSSPPLQPLSPGHLPPGHSPPQLPPSQCLRLHPGEGRQPCPHAQAQPLLLRKAAAGPCGSPAACGLQAQRPPRTSHRTPILGPSTPLAGGGAPRRAGHHLGSPQALPKWRL